MSKTDIDRKKICMKSRCKWRFACKVYWGNECRVLGGARIPRLIRQVPMEDPVPSMRPGKVVASAEPPKKKRKLFGILDIDKIVARKTADQAFCGR